MKMSKLRIKILILSNLVILILIGYFYFKSPMQNRKIASEDQSLIRQDDFNLSWKPTDSGLIIRVKSRNGSLCDKWKSMEVVFRAEGLAYSGEVDKVVQTTFCEEGRFQQTWVSHLTQVEDSAFQKVGFFGEEPPQWVLEQMTFDGPDGQRNLSSQEIYQQYGSIPTMTPK